MSKDLKIGLLNQIYGRLLTENQRAVAAYYYDDDLSLGEIAENTGVTRQAVRDTLVKAETALNGFEEALGLYDRSVRLHDRLAALRAAVAGNGTAEALIDEIGELL